MESKSSQNHGSLDCEVCDILEVFFKDKFSNRIYSAFMVAPRRRRQKKEEVEGHDS